MSATIYFAVPIPTAPIRFVWDAAAAITALERAKRSLSGPMIELALAAGALEIANRAKRNAPVGHDTAAPGSLRRSIHVGGHTDLTPDFGGGAGKAYKDIGKGDIGATTATVFVGTNIAYGRRIEYGFFGIDSLGREYHQPGQYYLARAVIEGTPAMARSGSLALKQLIARALA